MSSAEATWRLIGCSSLISIAGTLVIYADLVWNSIFPQKINILKSRNFMVASLALSGGVLLTTALHSLTANAIKYFRKGDLSKKQANRLLLAAVVTGIIICTVVNFLIHLATSKSIVHCAHSQPGQDNSHTHEHTHEHTHDSHEHTHQHSHTHEHNTHDHASEDTSLLDGPIRQYISAENFKSVDTPAKSSFIDKLQNKHSTGECRGFESIYHCAAEIALISNQPGEEDVSIVLGNPPDFGQQIHHSATEEEPHHHHVVPRGSEMLSIGLQTAFAITVHKFPEGFLIYATERNDKQVGLNVFFALAIHNFFEGFTIAVPLYLALGSRFKAVLYAALLSAGSQPLGALAAEYFLKGRKQKENYPEFGLLIGSTAGFMIIIGLQMLTTAVSYGGLPHKTIMWAVVGIVLVLVSKCF